MVALLVMYQTISSRTAFNFLNHDDDVTDSEITEEHHSNGAGFVVEIP